MKVGKVYKIVNNIDDVCYVGSTLGKLNKRFYDHTYNNCKSKELFEIYGIENCSIELIKEYLVVDRQHLEVYETLWMSKMNCVNDRTPFSLNHYRCYHGLKRHRCKDCRGASICLHNRQRNQCKDCKGSGICIHNRRRNYCKDCKGSSICEHNLQRNQCKNCGACCLKCKKNYCISYINKHKCI